MTVFKRQFCGVNHIKLEIMIKLKMTKILIPVDFSLTSMRAIKHGAFLAQLAQGELYLLHVRKRKDILDITFPWQELRAVALENQTYLQRTKDLAEKISKDYCIKVTAIVRSGSCPTEIIKAGEKHKVGLIVMGTQGSESNSSLFFGSNAFRVISKSEIPVITVRSDTPMLGYSKILLPIDSSKHSRQKVNSALQLAKMFASSVHVLGILSKSEDNYLYKMEHILSQIKNLAIEKNLVCNTEIVWSENPAAITLSQAKKLNADMVITMTDQHAGSEGLFAGTYDKQLVVESQIPILSIKPEIHEENIVQPSFAGM